MDRGAVRYLIIVSQLFGVSAFGTGDYQWALDQQHSPICTSARLNDGGPLAEDPRDQLTVHRVPANFLDGREKLRVEAFEKCEKDTEWVKEKESGNLPEPANGSNQLSLCKPISVTNHLDLSKYRKELAQSPHICVCSPKLNE